MQDISTMQDNRVPDTVMLDVTGEKCPMTFVRTRLALDGLLPGGLLAVHLRGAEPHKNVTQSVRALGHLILADQAEPDGTFVLTIQKKLVTPPSA